MHKNIDASMGNNPIKALVYHNTRKKFNEKVIFLYDFKNIMMKMGWIKFLNRPVINWFRILLNHLLLDSRIYWPSFNAILASGDGKRA